MPLIQINPLREIEIVKSLKRPDCTHIESIVFTDPALCATGKVLVIRELNIILAGTPIVVTGKTANCDFIYVKFVQFIVTW